MTYGELVRTGERPAAVDRPSAAAVRAPVDIRGVAPRGLAFTA